MLFRPVDENGDMMPVLTSSQMLTGGEAVRMAAEARVALVEGEWWEDPELGFRMYSMLIDSARAGDAQMLENYITAYLAQTQGCTGVINTSVELKNRGIYYNCTLLADDGSSDDLEVAQDVLLSTVY